MRSKGEISKLIQNSWLRFNSNMGALYAMFEHLSMLADEVDKAKIKDISNELAFIFKDKPEIVEKDISKYFPSIDDLDVYPDFRKDESAKEIIQAFQDQELREALLEWEIKHPHRAYRLKRAFSSGFNNPPMNGVLIRRSMLVSLVTFFEIFVEDTFKIHYLASGLSLHDAQKKAGKSGWKSQLKSIGLDIPVIQKYKDEVFEFSLRRNLLVHNDGVVDDKYTTQIPNRYEIGDQLLISTQYFQRAMDIFHMLGLFLFCNQLEKFEENKQVFQNILNDFVLTSLECKRYNLVLELSDNYQHLNLPEEKQKIIMVNRAIAFRELGRTEEVNNIVSILKTMVSDWRISIAISMLSNDIPALKRQIKKIPNSPNIVKILARPLFDPIKNEIWFKTECLRKSRPKPQINRKRRK